MLITGMTDRRFNLRYKFGQYKYRLTPSVRDRSGIPSRIYGRDTAESKPYEVGDGISINP